ncbi:MAG: four helix bundle protein [Bacteroidales bacterium]|nr:four helix bundle protein [Bacteroidales bacterium]
MGNFQELKVWQKGKDLAVYIYKLTQGGPLSKDYGLKDQMQRSSVSIPSNIAEGDELNTSKQAINHFYIAKGSSAELLTQSIIAHEIGYINKEVYLHIKEECESISSMLYKLIQVRIKNIK